MNRTDLVRRMNAGFTLIEVLISILILGLGLLGLGALFPAVIREQRQSSDRVSGLIAEKNLAAELPVLLGVDEPVRYSVRRAGARVEVEASYAGLVSVMEPWTVLNNEQPAQKFSMGRNLGLWETGWNWAGFADGAANAAGELRIGDATAAPTNVTDREYAVEFPASVRAEVERLEAQIRSAGIAVGERRVRRVIRPLLVPVIERVNLGAGEGAGTPTLVWDVVPGRVPVDVLAANGDAQAGDQMHLAVFVRRVDPGIRVPVGSTLRGVLAAGDALPVAVGTRSGDDANQPTFDGRGEYSLVVSAFGRDNRAGATPHFEFVDTPDSQSPESFDEQRRWVRVLDVEDPVGAQMAQVGQQLIDNLGNVYTVERVERDPVATSDVVRRIRLNPAPAIADTRLDANGRVRRLQQFIFTPQVPVAALVVPVRVSEVTP